MPSSGRLGNKFSGRPGWRTGAALFLITSVVYGLTASRTGDNLDNWTANYASWNLVTTGSPWLEGESIPQFENKPKREVWVLDPAPNGHKVMARSPGVIALGLPGYWVAQTETMTVVPAAMTASLVSALSVLLMFLALRTRLSRRQAALAAGVLAFATPVWTVSSDGIWPHTLTGLGIAGMAWASATRRWWLVGVFGGVSLWGRLHAAVIVATLGLVLGRQKRSARLVAKVAVPSLGFLVLVSVWCRWMYGSWSPMASYGGGAAVAGATQSHLDLINQAGMWISPDRGILVWTPILALLLPALVRSWSDLPEWSRGLLLGGLFYTVIQSMLITFTGGEGFFGYRLGLEFVVGATPAFAFAAHRVGATARGLLGPVIALQVFAMALGATRPLYMLESRVWFDNAFGHAMWSVGLAGLVLVGLAIGIGAAAQRQWSTLPREVPSSAETVSPPR